MANQHSKNRILDKVSAALVEFANSLKPSKCYIDTGNELCSNIFKMLRKSRHDVSMTCIAGSVGKETSVIYPDFDCVVFLNKTDPPLDDKVQEFEELLRERIVEFGIIANTLKSTHLTVTLEFTNGVEMDLLPASNFCAEKPERQRVHVMAELKHNPNHYSMYSSSLALTQIKFITDQSSATHQLIHLAKYWYKLCTLRKDIYGGCAIIEILCVDVAFDLDPCPSYPMKHSFHMLPAFKLFLEKVSTMNSLKLGFYHEANRWVKVGPHEFESAKFRNYFYDEIVERPNFIIEPSNPYNDLAKSIPPATFETLEEFSTEMVTRLDDLNTPASTEMKTVSGEGRTATLYVHYDRLFMPFIMSLREYYPHSEIPCFISIDYDYQHHQHHAHENAHELNPDFFAENILAKTVYKTVMNNILFLIRGKAIRKGHAPNGLSFTDGITDVNSRDDIRAAVNMFIQANFVKDVITESSANVDHAHHDVTLTIPYRVVKAQKPGVYSVRLSMKWIKFVESDSCQSCWPF